MDLKYSELNDYGYGLTVKVKETLCHEKTPFQSVDIIETEGLGRMMLMDGLVMTSEKDEHFYHEMITHIPMLSHKNPQKILVIGGGDGGTVREVVKHDCVENVTMCEIDGKAVEICKKYLPTIACELDNPKVNVVIGDGVEFVKDKKNIYDVILIDSTDPLGPGVGLFTEEFYTNVKNALKPNGIMVAQSESPIADKKEMKAMYSLLNKVFPVVKPYFGPIPTYPGGFWSWAFCSNDVKPLDYIDEKRASFISKTAKIYNTDIHKACFALPNYVKELIAD